MNNTTFHIGDHVAFSLAVLKRTNRAPRWN